MNSKQPNKDKNLEIWLPFKHASLSTRCRHALNSFAHSGFFAHTAKGGTENPLIWTLGGEKHLILDNLINSHLSCQSPSGLKDVLCHTLLRLLSNQRGVKQESKVRERERGSEKKEWEKGLFKWCYLSLPSSLASPAHSKSFTSVVHIMLRVRTHGTPLSFPHMVILRLKEEHVSKEMSLILDITMS